MSAETPLVSIGLPVYNGASTLRRAIDSLLAQDYPNFELMISDNASGDQTAAICEEYQAKDKRVHFFHNDANQGMVWNFKRVLNLAQGEYFMWAAHDDRWVPQFISSLLPELQLHPEAGVAMPATDLVDEDGGLVKPVRLDRGDKSPNELGYFSMLLRLLTLWGGSTKSHHLYFYGLFRGDLLQEAMGYFIDTAFGDRMFISMFALVGRFRYVPQVLYYKTKQRKHMLRRHPTENFAKAYHSLSRLFLTPFQLASMIWRCRLVPFRRKLYIPVAMLGMTKIIVIWILKNWQNK
jgi:glycosyltransferase involved in cell wall biosynthesis